MAAQAQTQEKKPLFFLDEIFSYQTLIKFRKLIYDGYTLQTPENSFSRLTYVNKNGETEVVEIQTNLQFEEFSVREIFSKLVSDDYLVLEQAKLIALIRFCNKSKNQKDAENEKLNEVFTVRQAEFEKYETAKTKENTKNEKPTYIVKQNSGGESEKNNKYLNDKQKAFLGIYFLIILITGLIWYFFFK